MANTEEALTAGQEPAGGAQSAEDATQEETSTSNTEGSTEGENGNTSALWEGIADDHPVRAEVANLRREAAAKRATAQQVKQENETLKASLAEAKTADEVQALIAEYDEKIAGLQQSALRESVARKHKLPDDLAELLRGDDEAALEAHAETLAKYAPRSSAPPQAPPSGGKVPNEPSVSVDDLVNKVRAHRR